MFGAGGLALYAGVFERHWLEIVYKEVAIGGLPAAFNGMRVAQLSDIHLNEFTEPFLLRESIDEINRAKPDMVLLTGDYVSAEVLPRNLTAKAAWQCGSMLSRLECPRRYAIFGNHDVWAVRSMWAKRSPPMGLRCLRTRTFRWSKAEPGCGLPG